MCLNFLLRFPRHRNFPVMYLKTNKAQAGARTFDLQLTNQMLYQCATSSFLNQDVGPCLISVHAHTIVHAVAGSYAFAGVSYLLLPLLASMTLPCSMMLPASMLLQAFLLLSAYCYWRPCSCLYPCSCWHGGTHALALPLLALLHYECCSMMSLLLLFFPHPSGLFRSLEGYLLHS